MLISSKNLTKNYTLKSSIVIVALFFLSACGGEPRCPDELIRKADALKMMQQSNRLELYVAVEKCHEIVNDYKQHDRCLIDSHTFWDYKKDSEECEKAEKILSSTPGTSAKLENSPDLAWLEGSWQDKGTKKTVLTVKKNGEVVYLTGMQVGRSGSKFPFPTVCNYFLSSSKNYFGSTGKNAEFQLLIQPVDLELDQNSTKENSHLCPDFLAEEGKTDFLSQGYKIIIVKENNDIIELNGSKLNRI